MCGIIEDPKQREGGPDRRATYMDIVGNIWSVGMQVSFDAN